MLVRTFQYYFLLFTKSGGRRGGHSWYFSKVEILVVRPKVKKSRKKIVKKHRLLPFGGLWRGLVPIFSRTSSKISSELILRIGQLAFHSAWNLVKKCLRGQMCFAYVRKSVHSSGLTYPPSGGRTISLRFFRQLKISATERRPPHVGHLHFC